MTPTPLRLAVVGMGDMGSSHARGFDALEECEVVATVDPDADWSKLRAIDWGGAAPRHYDNHKAMLEEGRPEAVVVATPDYLHRQVAEDVLHAGCDLLLEKPIAPSLADADAIVSMAAERNVVLQIGLVYRYSNLYRRMAAICAEPDHPVRLMWCKELRQCFPQKPWFYSQQATGGTMMEKDCHHFDLFNWMIGSKPVRVFATGGQHVWKDGSEIACNYCPDPPRVMEKIDTVDHALVTIDYENGGRASLILCMYLRPQNVMPEGLEVGAIALSGRQTIAYGDARLGVGGLGEPLNFERLDMLADNEGLGHIGAQQQRREFIACCRSRKRPAADAAVGVASMEIAAAAELSIREGRPIDIAELPR